MNEEIVLRPAVRRATWNRKLEFVLSLVGYAIGMGNIWRFPYVCMRNGGGAFLIPYLVSLIFCGIPVFYLELYIGQFSSRSPSKIWNICPILTGIGWGTVVIASVVIYYVILLTWVLYFLFYSFSDTLPWSSCDNEWNTDRCVHTLDILHSLTVETVNISIENSTAVASGTHMPVPYRPTSPAEEFFERKVLDLASGIDDIGAIKWDVFIFYCISWIFLFACLCNGVKSLGKVVYVTATVPYLLLVALLVRGITLPGSATGVKYFITPDFTKLLQPKVWVEANLQVFFSLGNGYGGIITMASYNKFNYKFNSISHPVIQRSQCSQCKKHDAVAVPLVNAATSLLGGLVIFSVIGFMAQQTGSTVEQVIRSGPGLTFIAYPEALSRMPGAPVWAVLFFLTLVTVSIDTFFVNTEAVISGLEDIFPRLRKYKVTFTASVIFLMFVLGLPTTTRGGMYVFQVVDWYSGCICLTLFSLAMCLVVAWLYGHERCFYDIECMTGSRPSIWWKVCLCAVTPAMLLVSMIYILTSMYPPYYGTYEYPWWAIAVGWLIASASILPVPIAAVLALWRQNGPLLERICKATKPNLEWGPANTEDRMRYKYAEEYMTNTTRFSERTLLSEGKRAVAAEEHI